MLEKQRLESACPQRTRVWISTAAAGAPLQTGPTARPGPCLPPAAAGRQMQGIAAVGPPPAAPGAWLPAPPAGAAPAQSGHSARKKESTVGTHVPEWVASHEPLNTSHLMGRAAEPHACGATCHPRMPCLHSAPAAPWRHAQHSTAAQPGEVKHFRPCRQPAPARPRSASAAPWHHAPG